MVDQDIGTVESDEGQVNTARVNLLYTHIVAPVTGASDCGRWIRATTSRPGDANGIVVINQLQAHHRHLPHPEDNVSALMRRLHDGGPMTVEAYDRTKQRQAGRRQAADRRQSDRRDHRGRSSCGRNSRMRTVCCSRTNSSTSKLLQELLQNQIIMPNSAVRRGAPNGVVSTFVYIVNADRTVSVRPVTLGVVDGERVAVAKGLSAGDVVVTEGGDRLRDGAQVLLPSAAPPSAAHPPGSPRTGTGAPGSSGQHRPRTHTKPSQ